MRPVRRVVCIGGGTGLAQVLKGLAGRPLRVTGVVGVTDNGGHSGVLRRSLGLPAVGDVRSCLAELARDPFWKQLLSHRFRGGELEGVSTGNLILAALCLREGSLSSALKSLTPRLELAAELLPVSDGNGHVCAKLASGRIVRGEWEIILRRPKLPVERLFHEPKLRTQPEVLERIRRAELVVFAPGCLLTGILSAVLTGGLREALARSRAVKLQVVNLMTQPGQTDGLGATGHVSEFERLSGVRPDVVVVNSSRPDAALVRRYGEHGARVVEDDIGPGFPARVVRGDFLERVGAAELKLYSRGGGTWAARPHFIRHDSKALARAIVSFLGAS